jgi:hypothetical protein
VRLIPRGCVPTHALFRTERQSFLGVRAFGLMSLEIRSSLVRGDRDEIVAPHPFLLFHAPALTDRQRQTTNLGVRSSNLFGRTRKDETGYSYSFARKVLAAAGRLRASKRASSAPSELPQRNRADTLMPTSFAWATASGGLSRTRTMPQTFADVHLVAFACMMLKLAKLAASPQQPLAAYTRKGASFH